MDATTPENAGDVLAALEGTSLEREVIQQDTDVSTVFHLPSGSQLTFSEDAAGNAESRLGGGVDGFRIYIDFNKVDQTAIQAGLAAGLTGAICAIPGVGTGACIVVGAIIAAATVYLNSYGTCPHNLRVETGFGARDPRCV